MSKQYHISLNSQFTVVVDGIICFSEQFCDNSLLVLKMRFHVFSFASKKVHGTWVPLFFQLQNYVPVFFKF